MELQGKWIDLNVVGEETQKLYNSHILPFLNKGLCDDDDEMIMILIDC